MKRKYVKSAGEAGFADFYVTKANEILIPYSNESVGAIGIIGAPLSKTSISHSGAHLAPNAIRKMLASYSTYHIEDNKDLKDTIVTDFGDIEMHVTNNEESRKRIEESIREIVESYPALIPIVLGGDHGISYPSVKALSSLKGRVGVIQFDAHHDLRNLADGGRSNGTPFRSLLESGIINGKHLFQIGIRNFSNSKPYTEYGRNQRISMYTMKDVKSLGIESIMKDCLEKLEQEVDIIYVSVDMDVLDQAFAPGCPAIGPGGMSSDMLLDAISILAQHKMVGAMDIVEIDPSIDFRDMTSRVAAHVILHFLVNKF